MDIQKRIDQFVKHMPDGRIQFMGYVWPAELITPDYDFHEIRHPKIMQCLEYILGVDLSFYFNGPPKGEINQEEIGHHIGYIRSWANVDRGKNMIVEQINNTSLWDEFIDFDEFAFQVYDDIVKDIHIGDLPAGKDGTIPRQEFLKWLDDYMKHDGGSNVIDYSVLSFKEQAEYVKKWKAEGPQHKTNAQIMKLLWPDEAAEAKKLAKNDPVFERLRGRIKSREGKR